MEKKKIVVIASVVCIAIIAAVGILKKDTQNGGNVDTSRLNKQVQSSNTKSDTNKQSKVSNNNTINGSGNNFLKQAHILKEDSFNKKADLFNNDSGFSIPLSAISVLSTLPQSIQNKVSKIAEVNSIYMIQKNGDKLLVITDNPANIRHSIEFTEISIGSGHQTKTTLGYNDKIKDSDNDIWEYNHETSQPTRHTKYNSDGDVEFVEV